MCLMALALGQSSRWPVLLASNRDEFHERPTQPLSRWSTPEGIAVISGRDLRAGGTWLGCTPAGRVALLTNYREPGAPEGLRTRGELPLRWLSASGDSAEFLARTAAADYAGCNLLLGDVASGQWTWASNRGDALQGWQFKHLPPGIYGLSNALLDTPWPKTLALKAGMTQALAAAEARSKGSESRDSETASTELQSRLWAALSNRSLAARQDLPHTGIDPDLEHGLSSAWVDLPARGYGTRCSSLLWLEAAQGHEARPASGRAHQFHMVEKTWTLGSDQPSVSTLNWSLTA